MSQTKHRPFNDLIQAKLEQPLKQTHIHVQRQLLVTIVPYNNVHIHQPIQTNFFFV